MTFSIVEKKIPAVTLEQLALAFEAWENNRRVEPTRFLSDADCAVMEVSDLAADRAAYMYELLSRQR